MQSIADNVYIEESFAGITLGAIRSTRGLVHIDAPPSPDDSRTWRASLMNIGAGPERLLVNLDTHPDRTLGARSMDCVIIAHEQTAQVFRNRPTTFKAQGDETGSSWESITGLGSVRWAPPEISFTDSLTLHWGDIIIHLDHRPGPTSGAIWVTLPVQKVVFIGDLVPKNQPPFLSHADLPAWIEALKLLQGGNYKGFTIVSGRGGAVTQQMVKAQLEIVKHINDRMEKLAARNASVDAAEKLADGLLAKWKAPAARQKYFAQRLRHGLGQYYMRHHRHSNALSDE